jgi:hypothetical protein
MEPLNLFNDSLNDVKYFGDLLFGTPRSPLVLESASIVPVIDSQHFMRWLAVAHPEEKIMGNYAYDCSSMCEFACLYMGMLFYDTPEILDRFRMYYGRFGGWEHYWLSYTTDNGEEYFVDLTLRQFCGDVPELSITKAHNQREPGRYSYLSPPDSLRDYIKSMHTFEWYPTPSSIL